MNVIMPKKKRSAFALKLRAVREAESLTQKAAAERAGVALRTWIAWENDQHPPGRLTMQLLKHAFPKHF